MTGVDRKLVGIEVAGDALPFELSRKCDALSGGKPVGTVTDLIWSPRLEKNIGYVWVPIGLADPGNELEIVAPDGGIVAGPDRRDPVPRPAQDRPARLIAGAPSMTLSPLTPEEIAAVRRPYRAASLLPGRAYHDPAIHEFERERWFRRDWLIVGREEDAATPGTYFLAEVDDEPLIVVRGRDGVIRAFYNVCRHRGTAVVEEPCGKAVRFQCPYHAWIYDLDGSLIRAKHTDDLDDFSLGDLRAGGRSASRLWQGFVFVSLDAEARELADWLGDLATHLDRFDFGGAASRPHRDLRGRGQLEVHRRELQRVLPLPGHPPAAQQADALRPRRRLRPRRSLAGRLDGARRRRRDDGARRRSSGRPAGDGRHHRAR